MDMPAIRYANTPDDVSLAYFDTRAGYPLLHVPYPMNHLQLQWRFPFFRRIHEEMASRYRLIAYDGRGQGLSDAEAPEFSLEAGVRDAETIVASAGLERFAIYAGYTAPVALVYAARHPEQVSHVVLWSPMGRSGGPPEAPISLDAVHGLLAQIDWELYLDTLAFWLGFGDGSEMAHAVREYLGEGVRAEAHLRVMQSLQAGAYEEEMRRVEAPVLILQPRQLLLGDLRGARRLAGALPHAELTVLDGRRGIPVDDDDLETTIRAIERFLPQGGRAPGIGGLQTIGFSDVVDSTALTDRFGDAHARQLMRTHERLTREALAAHGGREIKTMGDGFMAAFDTASAALDWAVALQRSMEAHNTSAGEPLYVRIGLNTGEPIAEEEDLHGTAVIVAARVAAQAGGGEIFATDVVRQLVAGKGYLFHDRGPAPLKGFDEPVRLYEVHWRDA